MRTLKTGSRVGVQKPACLGKISRNSRPPGVISAGPLVSARLIHCVASSPSYSTSLVHLFTHPVVMTHAPLFVTAHHVPTLSRSHTIWFDSLSHCLALSRSHTEARSLYRTSCHMVSSSVNISHRLALFRLHLTVCRATGRFNAPTLSHARFDAPFNAQVPPTVVAPSVAAHTHCCANHCCTTAAPYSTPLITPTTAALILHHTAHHSSHQPLLRQSLLNQPLLHRPLLHRPLLH